jgi:hypothetical protein
MAHAAKDGKNRHKSLDGVPAEKLHSPALAIAAMRDALKCYAPASPA